VDRAENEVAPIAFGETICLQPKHLTREPSVEQGANAAWFEFQYATMNRGAFPRTGFMGLGLGQVGGVQPLGVERGCGKDLVGWRDLCFVLV
jgi:hypothetical protein